MINDLNAVAIPPWNLISKLRSVRRNARRKKAPETIVDRHRQRNELVCGANRPLERTETTPTTEKTAKLGAGTTVLKKTKELQEEVNLRIERNDKKIKTPTKEKKKTTESLTGKRRKKKI